MTKTKNPSLLEQIAAPLGIAVPPKAPAAAVNPLPSPPVAPEQEALELSGDEKVVPLPSVGSPYKAHHRPENKALLTLRLVLGDGAVRGVRYANITDIDLLPADKPGSGPVIVVHVAGVDAREIRMHGRNLDLLYNWLCFDRISWVRMLPAGKIVADPLEAVITLITMTRLES